MSLPQKTVKLDPTDQLKLDKSNEQELTRYQREYRNFANGRYAIKEDKSKARYLEKNLEQSKKERKTINTQLYVAMGSTNVEFYETKMKEVELHVNCQEGLKKHIDTTKIQLEHLHNQIKRVERSIYDLNMNSVSEHQYKTDLAKAPIMLEILENKVNVSKKRECETIAINARLRSLIDHMLYDRALFNILWKRMIVKLAHDKKFYVDMVERAILAFNQGADLCNELDALRDQGQRDKKVHVQDMMGMLRRLDADSKIKEFLGNKGQTRVLQDLEKREYDRRDMFRRNHQRTLGLYNAVLSKIKKFSGFNEIEKVIAKFNRHEDEYFAHFNYMNELNHQVESLTVSLDDLYEGIDAFREYNEKKELYEKKKIQTLTEELSQQTKLAEAKLKEQSDFDVHLMELLNSVTVIFRILKCDSKPMESLLGDHTKVTKFNIKRFMTILESRLNTIIAYIYTSERRKNLTDTTFIVRSVERPKVEPTPIEDVVLVQQCAECAEGEDVNRYDEEIVLPMELKDIKEKLHDKIKAPEMQYRLHNISKCRLPRSRTIVNRRYL